VGKSKGYFLTITKSQYQVNKPRRISVVAYDYPNIKYIHFFHQKE